MASDAAGKNFPFSPLVLADRLLTLAELADREGLRDVASSLVQLADRALDHKPAPWRTFHGRSSKTAANGRSSSKRSSSAPRAEASTASAP